MGKKKVTEDKSQINTVLKYHDQQLKNIEALNRESIDKNIDKSEQLLSELGYNLPSKKMKANHHSSKEEIIVYSLDEIYEQASQVVKGNCSIESIFTDDEIKQNQELVRLMNMEFNQIHKLDKMDVAIGAIAGMVGAAVDILLVGIPEKTQKGVGAGPLSNFIRDYFDKKFPEEEMQKLANSRKSKVPFDAQDNRNTKIHVEGLSAYYHRLCQLGHDPILGFIFGVIDILTGRMTTIDKKGKMVSQVMNNYADRKEINIFKALAKQIAHLKSDITTSMGLPTPFMSLFNMLQFGSVGDEEQKIAEIVQSMYYEGYDFIHFCSMTIPAMIVEVIVRMGYAFKRIKEGYSIKESIPLSLNIEKHPKLATMLFLVHSAAAAVNAGKVIFSKNPMAINYPQWIAFTKYSYSQLKWALMEKPSLREAYVDGKIYGELQDVYDEIDAIFKKCTKDKIVIYN